MPEKAGLTAAQGIADMPIQTERKVTDRKSVTFLYISNVSSAQASLQAKANSRSRSIAGKSQLRSDFIADKSKLLL